MNKIQKTAKGIDLIFHILQIATVIAFAAAVIVVAVMALGTFTDIASDQIGTSFNGLEIGNLSIILSEDYPLSEKEAMFFFGITFIFAGAALWVCKSLFTSVRKILATVINGLPFDSSVGENLKKVALKTFIFGLLVNAMELINYLVAINVYKLPQLLINDKITGVTYSGEFDLTFLLFAAIIYLAATVCEYGAKLQKEVDETL